MYEIVFTEICFEECEYFKETKMIVARSTEELLKAFVEFDLLSIFIYSVKEIQQMTRYQEACRKAGAVIVLEKKKKIDCDDAIRLIYADDRS